MLRSFIVLTALAACLMWAGTCLFAQDDEYTLPPVKLKPERPTTAKPIPPIPEDRSGPSETPTETPKVTPSDTAKLTPTDTAKAPPIEAPKLPPLETPKAPPVETPKAPPVEMPKGPPMEMPKLPPVEAPKTLPAPLAVPTETPAPVEAPKLPPVETPKVAPAPVETPKLPPVEAPKATVPVEPAPVEMPKLPPVETIQIAPVETPKAPPVETPKVVPAPIETPKLPPLETPKVAPVPVETPKMTPVETPKATMPVEPPAIEMPTLPPIETPTPTPVLAPKVAPVVTPKVAPVAVPVAAPKVAPVVAPKSVETPVDVSKLPPMPPELRRDPPVEVASPVAVAKPTEVQSKMTKAMVEPEVEADLSNMGEVGLVEEVVRTRKAYAHALQALKEYYQGRANVTKIDWINQELNAYNLVPKLMYLSMTERAGPELRPMKHVEAADQFYKEGMQYKDYPAMPPGKKDYLKIALDKFQTIIEKYPDSDKIADAAFRMGEIYGGWYFQDYARAVQAYERCWQWQPKTLQPAVFNAAKIYDEKLTNRVKAVELYNRVMSESADQNLVNEARNRIKALTGK